MLSLQEKGQSAKAVQKVAKEAANKKSPVEQQCFDELVTLAKTICM